MPTTNPIRLLHAAIWTMLEANTTLTGLVKVMNRIKYTGTVQEKDVVSQADVPELRVVSGGYQPHVQQTSSSSKLTVLWMIQVTSGDIRFENGMDVDWEVYRAMVDWEDYMKTLLFNSKRFVTMSRPLTVRARLEDPRRGGGQDTSRGIRGWRTVWAGESQLDFTTNDLNPNP